MSGKGKQEQEKKLVSASDRTIQRYIKIKNEANPFDSAWRPYFAQRAQQKMAKNLEGKARFLWRRQKGTCPYCLRLIQDPLGWYIHTNPVMHEEETSDQILVHKECKRATVAIHNSWPFLTEGLKMA